MREFIVLLQKIHQNVELIKRTIFVVKDLDQHDLFKESTFGEEAGAHKMQRQLTLSCGPDT